MREQESASVASDAELVADMRAGDRRAMAELYARHSADAVRVGRLVCPGGDADDLAAEAFARVFTKIVDGGGPTDHFRGYLRAVIRNLNIERSRQASREQPASDKLWLLDVAAEGDGEQVDELNADRAARALRSLPENWRQLLWRLEVQGSKPAQVAAELSIPVATVYDTAYRAREGLRLAYLDQHLPAAGSRGCEWTRSRLSRLARGSLSPRASAKARDHLDDCVECADHYAALHQLNTRLGAAIWPIVLVGGITLGGFNGTTPRESAPPSDPPGQSGAGIAHSGARALGSSFAAPGRLAAVAAVVLATLVAVAVVGPRVLLRHDGSPRASASPPQKPAPTPLLPPPSDDPTPESIDDPSLGRRATADSGVPDQHEGVGTVGTVKSEDAPEPQEDPGQELSPEPGHGDEPAPEPEPVDLELGAPTIEATEVPFQWRFTVPVLATESAAATSSALDLELATSEPTGFIERLSPRWDCGPIEDGGGNGDPYFFGNDVRVNCHYTYEPGQTVTPLQLILESISAPTGTVTISSNDNVDPDASNDIRAY